MRKSNFSRVLLNSVWLLTLLFIGACGPPESPSTGDSIPIEYASKHMPEGWWVDQSVIEEGRQIYLGHTKSTVNCANCHGKNGKPVRSGTRDLRDTVTMKKFSDSHLLWRISEGVSFTKMGAYKSQLSEDEIWKVIAFIGTLGMEGLQYDPIEKAWVTSPKG